MCVICICIVFPTYMCMTYVFKCKLTCFLGNSKMNLPRKIIKNITTNCINKILIWNSPEILLKSISYFFFTFWDFLRSPCNNPKNFRISNTFKMITNNFWFHNQSQNTSNYLIEICFAFYFFLTL